MHSDAAVDAGPGWCHFGSVTPVCFLELVLNCEVSSVLLAMASTVPDHTI